MFSITFLNQFPPPSCNSLAKFWQFCWARLGVDVTPNLIVVIWTRQHHQSTLHLVRQACPILIIMNKVSIHLTTDLVLGVPSHTHNIHPTIHYHHNKPSPHNHNLQPSHNREDYLSQECSHPRAKATPLPQYSMGQEEHHNR